MLKSIGIAIAVLACGVPGFGCSCFETFCSAVSNDRTEFLGTATRQFLVNDISAGRPTNVATEFTVSETFGKLGDLKKITVQSRAESTACGYPFKVGIEYLVATKRQGSTFSTSSCSTTRPALAASARIKELRSEKAGKRVAQIFGFIGTEDYPGVSPLSRLSAKPVGHLSVSAVGAAGEFTTTTREDGSFEFYGLPKSAYRLKLRLPPTLLVWFASNFLGREYRVQPGTACEADIPLYPKGDPYGR